MPMSNCTITTAASSCLSATMSTGDRRPVAVVDRVVAGFPTFETVALKGNHEQMLLDFVSDAELVGRLPALGGAETLDKLRRGPRSASRARRRAGGDPRCLPCRPPRQHHDFLRSLSLSYDCGDYHFVHAGVRPGVPLHLQTEEDRLWIRDQFLTAGDVFDGRVIVHGHTPTRDPENLGFRVGIDTGAYMTGRLTAAKFHGADIQFLHS